MCRSLASQAGWNFDPHPREGGDVQLPIHLRDKPHFDPHPREGGDVHIRQCREAGRISIHTPARGVTIAYDPSRRQPSNFDPHPREGGDFPPLMTGRRGKNFDPHPREGGDGGD